MFKRVDHIEIVARDAPATIRFYVDVLGFQIRQRVAFKTLPMREVVYLRLGDTVVEVIDVAEPQAKTAAPFQVGYRALALEVEDMAQAVEHLRSFGVSMSRPPVDLGDSYRGELLDPDGLIIELRQWKQPNR